MPSRALLPALLPVLIMVSAIATELPIQAQTVIYRNRVDYPGRDDYYPRIYRSDSDYRRSSEIEDSTLVNPVIVDPQIRDSTLINPVIVEPGQTYPSRSYPSRSYPSRTVQQTPASRNPSCVDFASLRVACQ